MLLITAAGGGPFDTGNGPVAYAPKPPKCEGWWHCLNDTAQASIIAATILGACLVLAAVIVSRRRKGNKPSE